MKKHFLKSELFRDLQKDLHRAQIRILDKFLNFHPNVIVDIDHGFSKVFF